MTKQFPFTKPGVVQNIVQQIITCYAKEELSLCPLTPSYSENTILAIPVTSKLSPWRTLSETVLHCGIEMTTCTLIVQQNILKLSILGQF